MTTSPTLLVDRLMLHPDFAEIAERLADTLPTWYRDQLGAATTQAHAGLQALGSRMNAGPPVGLATQDVPGWLRLGVIDAMVGYLGSTAATCLHNPAADRPEPVVAAAWRPGHIVCVRCVHLLVLPRSSAANRRCDGCGHECAGPDIGDPIYPGATRLGSLLYQFGVCGSCRPDALDGREETT